MILILQFALQLLLYLLGVPVEGSVWPGAKQMGGVHQG
jgi:hypothetical protein